MRYGMRPLNLIVAQNTSHEDAACCTCAGFQMIIMHG